MQTGVKSEITAQKDVSGLIWQAPARMRRAKNYFVSRQQSRHENKARGIHKKSKRATICNIKLFLEKITRSNPIGNSKHVHTAMNSPCKSGNFFFFRP